MKKCQVKTLFLMLMTFSMLAAAGSPDEDAVKTTIESVAKAFSAFPRTLDANSVLKFYASDAIVIGDGKMETAEARKKSLDDLEEMVNLHSDNPPGISSRSTVIQTQVLQPGLVFALYDNTTKIAIGGKIITEQTQKCSVLYKKSIAGWLIQHEHCSSVKSSVAAAEIQEIFECDDGSYHNEPDCTAKTEVRVHSNSKPSTPEENGAVPLQ